MGPSFPPSSHMSADIYFSSKIASNPRVYKILIGIDPPSTDQSGGVFNKVIMTVSEDKLRFDQYSEDMSIDFIFHPQTQMTDYEIIDPYTPNSIRIEQGIGVIILDPIKSYIKLYYDKSGKYGISPIYSGWNHAYESKRLFYLDFIIGYDMLLITKKGGYTLRNNKETLDDWLRLASDSV